jgi:hypothetical protein
VPQRPAPPPNPPAVRPSMTPTPQAATPPPQRPPEPALMREAEPISQPVISGPSFLGLNQPASGRTSSPSGPGSHLDSSPRSLDYLLEDEEQEPRGRGKFVLIAIALLLALGLGYLRGRNLGLEWLTSGLKKPAEIAQGQDAQSGATPGAQSSSSASTSNSAAPASGSASTPGISPTTNPNPGQSGAQPSSAANPPGVTTAPGGREVVPVDSDAVAKPPADSGASPATDKGAATSPAAASGPPADSTDAATDATSGAAKTKTNPVSKAGDERGEKTNQEDAESSDDDEAAHAAKAAPAATKSRAGKPADTVAEGEKYIYGRGVAQDCDRGLRMVRQAANQSNAQAMISLGALYSAGLCAPRDLPTAYRWFAVALRKDPENNSVQTDLKKLWSEMTPPERQLAIKLSQ